MTTQHASEGGAERPVLAAVVAEPLSVDEVLAAVAHPRAGAVVMFVGAVRDHDGGRGVTRLDYSAHPQAGDVLRRLVGEAGSRPGVVSAAAVHRAGTLAVGDLAVVLAVAAEHRREAFEACQALIDELKARTPIWKHQVFDDGDSVWVGTP